MVELKDYYTINSIYEESLETIMIYTGLKDLSLIEKVALRRIIQSALERLENFAFLQNSL